MRWLPLERRQRPLYEPSSLQTWLPPLRGPVNHPRLIVGTATPATAPDPFSVADVITSKEETELADMINGISKDGMAKELQNMRDLRHEMRAEARVSREMAGTDSKAQEAQFLEYARSNTATDEFDSLLGVAEGKEGAETAAGEPEKIEKTSSDSILPE